MKSYIEILFWTRKNYEKLYRNSDYGSIWPVVTTKVNIIFSFIYLCLENVTKNLLQTNDIAKDE